MKQWLLLLIPLLIILSVFALSSLSKNPEAIINDAEQKLEGLDSYLIKSELVMDMGIMGSVSSYVSNATNAFLNNESYSKVVTNIPFTGESLINEYFVLDKGNFSCTDSLSRPICLQVNESVSVDQDFVDAYTTISSQYLGEKSVNGVSCNAVLSKINTSSIDLMIDEYVGSDVSSLNDVFYYTCIDPVTGLSLDSLWGINGVSDFNGLLIDIGVNVSKRVTSFSREVPESLFQLPYKVVSQDEYLLLVNESYSDILSQSL